MRQLLKNRYRLAVLCLSGNALLAGCATYTDPVRESSLSIERVSSQRADVGYVYLRDESGKYWVRGTVKKRFLSRGPIPGHVHITLISPAGEILSDIPVRYMRKSVKSRSASLEKYMESAEPMPFIVDDVLVDFDDARSQAALNSLAHLAEKTQVILFTHHSRVVEQSKQMRENI